VKASEEERGVEEEEEEEGDDNRLLMAIWRQVAKPLVVSMSKWLLLAVMSDLKGGGGG